MATGGLLTLAGHVSDATNRVSMRESEQYVERLENRLTQVRSGSTESAGGSIKSNSHAVNRARRSTSAFEDSATDSPDSSDADEPTPNIQNSTREKDLADLEGQALLPLATPFAGAQERISSTPESSAIRATLASPRLSSSFVNTSMPESGFLQQSVSQTNDGKIHFHDIVRIAGGLAYKPKKRKKRRTSSFQSSLETDPVDTYRKRPNAPCTEGSKSVPSLLTMSASSGDSIATVHRSTLQPSTSHCSMVASRGTTPPRPRLAKPGVQAGSSPPSAAWQSAVQKLRLARHPSGLTSLRRPSMSDSVSGSVMASTIASGSTSPASSIYVPLRVPIVRAPAPFYGPTPERVTRVRERRKVAERDAERARGGWKAWWNNWYYQSDNFAARKGKMTSVRQHDQHPHHHESECDSSGELCEEDSDDGECYHDVVLEHERSKLERQLNKRKRNAAAPLHPRASQPPEPSSVSRPADAVRWLPQWWGTAPSQPASRLSAPPLPAKPVRGILRADSLPNSPFGVRTPLLDSSHTLLPQYVNAPASAPTPKTDVDVRFGRAPKRWLRLSWWTWKIRNLVGRAVRAGKAKFVDLFHVDWDTDSEHYEGWENT